MNRYLVKFFKKVVGGDHHEHSPCQFWVEVVAPDEAAAKEEAKKQFCKAYDISVWLSHADTMQVFEMEFPS